MPLDAPVTGCTQRGAAGWAGGWAQGRRRPSRPVLSALLPRMEAAPCTPPPSKPQALRPCCPPRKNTGEQPQGGGAMGSPPPHRSANSYPPPTPAQIHDLPTTRTRWACPVPAGGPPQSQGEEGTLPDRSRAEGPVRTGRGPGTASRRQAGRAPPPAAAAPSARHPRAEPRLRWAWGSPPQLLGTPALSGPCTCMRIPHTCAITLMHTQHTHTHAHTYT